MRFGFALGLAMVMPVTAFAHIHLVTPLSRIDTEIGNDQKEQHCGVAGQVRNAARVTTYQKGATIMVTWKETIQHPGWFRIAFQPNADTFPIPPASNGTSNVGGTIAASNMPTEDLTGMTNAATGAIVLADRVADGLLMQQIQLPDMECTNCTLQFIQVMIDKPPYTIDLASDDIYFNCADITLTAGPPPMVDAGVDVDAPPGGNNNNPSTTGGCSTGGGVGLLVGFALLGLVVRRRRIAPPAARAEAIRR